MNSSKHLRLLNLIKPHAKKLLLGLFFMLVAVATQLAYPLAIANFMDNLLTQTNDDWMWRLTGIMFVIFLIQGVAIGLRHFIFQSTGEKIVISLRRRLFQSLLQQEIGFYDQNKVGELTNRISMDIDVLKHILSTGFAASLKSVVTFLGATGFLIYLSPKLSLLLVLFLPVAYFGVKWAGQIFSLRYQQIQDNLASCNQIAQESFSNIKLIHAFNKQQSSENKYTDVTKETLNHVIACQRIFAGLFGLGAFLQWAAILIMVLIGGQLVFRQVLTIGELTSFVLYASMAVGAIGSLSSFWGNWMKAIGSTARVFELLERESVIKHIGGTKITGFKGKIEFKQVKFSYPTRANVAALDSINLNVSPGETLALVGASGSGKSTIANLLLGHYLPQNGQILFDDLLVDDLDIAELRKEIAIVEQEPVLFSGSISDNIRFAANNESIKQKQIIEVARLAYAHDFISAFPDAYATILGERGVQLSGGQKQRIAIARAILRDPKILILDEATSALDSESENLVQRALENLMRDRTTIIIAHRLSTIVKADRILVIDKGKVIQCGTHGTLINQTDKPYKKLMERQTNSIAL